MERELASLEELQEEAGTFVSTLSPKETGATLVTLSGELGAGKTSFTQGIARALGVRGSVTSPTFVLMKIYALTGRAFTRLVHIDAYRLQAGKELTALGFDEVMEDNGNLVVLEWPERVGDTLPTPDVSITLSVTPTNTRTITYAR